ncbi:winged helix-turn-helix domain-containing protein [Nitriliruptoraceae bacterium ZYF776]|nr:winged helix-turn-helix domain-containing protein [Profundirhabdus halotolerans]
MSLPTARRLALTAQGLDQPRPPAGVRRDVRHLRRVAAATDIVQLDSVNVLARAHELPFWSRIGPHDRAARDAWLWRSRERFEGWVHVASTTAMDVWHWFHHFRDGSHFSPRFRTFVREERAYLDAVLAEVADRGPATVQDLADPGSGSGPWWGWSKGKEALDALFRLGELAVHDRTSQFVTVYDLPERVVPEEVRTAEVPPLDEVRERLLLRAARAHGVATLAELADHHRQRVPAARPALARLVERGELEEVRVRGLEREPRFALPGARVARTIPARTLLSPFDPVVWHRPRTEALHDFHYRIEIYVPEPKRTYGYYVLPFLLGDRLVARVDLKADRNGGVLLVRGAFAEPWVDRAVVARELAAELAELGAWLDVPEVVVGDRGDLATPLRRAVTA